MLLASGKATAMVHASSLPFFSEKAGRAVRCFGALGEKRSAGLRVL